MRDTHLLDVMRCNDHSQIPLEFSQMMKYAKAIIAKSANSAIIVPSCIIFCYYYYLWNIGLYVFYLDYTCMASFVSNSIFIFEFMK